MASTYFQRGMTPQSSHEYPLPVDEVVPVVYRCMACRGEMLVHMRLEIVMEEEETWWDGGVLHHVAPKRTVRAFGSVQHLC